MQRPMLVDESKDAVDEFLRFEVGNGSKRAGRAEMFRLLCIAAGTAQRTFAGYFDREVRVMP
jgi:hypothetical protein